MLSVFYVLLWQLLTLVLSFLVVAHHTTARQLIIPAIILLQMIQQLSTLFSAVRWMESAYLTTMVLVVQVGGFGWLFIRYIKIPYVSFITKILVGLQGFCIILLVLMPSSSIPTLYHALLCFNSVVVLVPITSILYGMLKNPPQPFQSNSFHPIVWVACGAFFYFFTSCCMLLSKIWLPVSDSIPVITGWYNVMGIVQQIVMYVFFTVAFVICLRQPAQSL